MTLTIINQRPAQFTSVHTLPITGDYDPVAGITATIVEPLFTPLNQNHAVEVRDTSTNPSTALDQDAVTELFLNCLGDNVNAIGETGAKALLDQGSIYYDPKSPLLVNELFAVQAGVQNKFVSPTPTVIYTAQSDIIPAAKKLLAGQTNDASEMFASIAYAFHPETLGFWFQSSAAFDDFKAWLVATTSNISSALPPDTTKLLTQFAGLSLKGLTESLRLRADDTEENEEYSFARVIIHMLMDYARQMESVATHAQPPVAPEAGVMPFLLSELYSPRTIVLVNVEAHARSTGGKVSSEWKLIEKSISSPLKIVSNKALTKLTAMNRAAAKAQSIAQMGKNNTPGRSGKVVFRKQPPTKVDLASDISRVLKRMGQVNRSQNVFRQVKSSFARANRRDPDDWNKPGKITSTQYMPDIHVFVDTSGSISEANYQESMIMLISMAKKLNVNLYFNSFSSVLSQERMLRTANKSVTQIWQEFTKMPKVTGGTEFKQVWDYICESPTRRRRLSLMITDFEWSPPTKRTDHPKNLYYAPCSAMDWKTITHYAENYTKQMRHIEPTIAQRMLGLIK